MTEVSFDVAMFKVLRYAYTCLQRDVHPNFDKARELSGVGNLFFCEIVESAKDAGYLRGVDVRRYRSGQDPIAFASKDWGITRAGATFVDNDDAMKNAAKMVGEMFWSALGVALNAAAVAALGLG